MGDFGIFRNAAFIDSERHVIPAGRRLFDDQPTEQFGIDPPEFLLKQREKFPRAVEIENL